MHRIMDMSDEELVADARMMADELNRIHQELAVRGVTIDWFTYNNGATFRTEYARITKREL